MTELNKLLIAIIIICCIAGFAIQYFGVYNIAGAVMDLPKTIPAGISELTADPVGAVSSHGESIVTGISGVAGASTIFGMIYSKFKQKSESAIAQEQEISRQISQNNLAISSQKDAAEALAKSRLEELNIVENSKGSLEDKIQSLQSQVQQLKSEKAEIKKINQFLEDKVDVTPKPEPKE